MNIQRILVPVDFSEGSRAAVRYAVFLAETFGASIDVMHVWEPTPYVPAHQLGWLGNETRSFWQQMSDALGRQLDELLRDVAPDTTVRIDRRVEAGYVAESILHKLERGEHDLVVMGTHGRTGLRHVLLGSVAERIVRLSPTPVLTVRVPRDAEAKAAREREKADSVRPEQPAPQPPDAAAPRVRARSGKARRPLGGRAPKAPRVPSRKFR
jgi:nucleotide-binding universal stress UspA family protein